MNHNRRRFLQTTGAGLAALAAPGALRGLLAQSDAKRNPNIVFIMADDMGYGDPQCYNPESKTPTPNIDRLASQGVRFTDAHSPGAWCVPSRYGLLTGRYPCRPPNLNVNHPLIESDRMTIASLLEKNGYETGAIGKWHLGFEGGAADRDFSKPLRGGPVDVGFDYYFGIHASLDIPPYYYIENRRAVEAPTEQIEGHNTEGWTRIQGAFWRGGKIAPDFKHQEVLPKFTEKAIDFIEGRERQRKNDPFFLYLALSSPHTPWLPTKPYQGKTDVDSYGDFVYQVDDCVGRVLKALDEQGLTDDTLVVFTSDNGPVWFKRDTERYHHNARGPLRGMKADMWEGGHRMPFIARWPGKTPKGATCDSMICFTDMMATFAALVGDELPPDAGEDSFNILPLMLGEHPGKPPREQLLIEGRVIRWGPWKLIVGQAAGGLSRSFGEPEIDKDAKGYLYNLDDDPGETTNLYDSNPNKVRQLEAMLRKIKKQGRSRPVK